MLTYVDKSMSNTILVLLTDYSHELRLPKPAFLNDERQLVFLGLLYFIQGIPYGLQSSLLPVYLRGAGHSLTRISLTKILYFPWVLKVLWAPLVDRTGTKRCWLVGTVAGLALTCLVSATISPDVQYMSIAGSLLTMNMLASVQDIAADGAAVRLLRGRGSWVWETLCRWWAIKLALCLLEGGSWL